MDSWWGDWRFRRVAQWLWPDDYDAATACVRVKGRASAKRRMAARWEGFRCMQGLVRTSKDIAALVEEVRRG